MIDCLGKQFVNIKKKRQCFGCLRNFEVNSRMHREVYAYNREVYSIYTCPTCVDYLELSLEGKVLTPDDYLDEGWFWEGLNYNLRGTKSPEEILAELRYEKSIR